MLAKENEQQRLAKQEIKHYNKKYGKDIINALLSKTNDAVIKSLAKQLNIKLFGISSYIVPYSDAFEFEKKMVNKNSLSISMELGEQIIYVFLYSDKLDESQNYIDNITRSNYSSSMFDTIEHYYLEVKRECNIQTIHDVQRISLYFLKQDENYQKNSNLIKEYISLQLLSYSDQDIYKYLIKFQNSFVFECNRRGIYIPNEHINIRKLSYTTNAKFTEISLTLNSIIHAYSEYAAVLNDNLNHQIILRSQKFIMDNYNKKITLKDLSTFLDLSSSHVSKVLSNNNSSFTDLLNQVRIDKAKSLLESNKYMNITQITFASGYQSANYFARVFKKHVGLTPSQYQQMVWNKK